MNISSHSSWTAITPNSQSLKPPVFESSTFHWDHGRQYVMYITTPFDSVCVQVGLSRVVTLYLNVLVLSPPQTDSACLPAVLLSVAQNTFLRLWGTEVNSISLNVPLSVSVYMLWLFVTWCKDCAARSLSDRDESLEALKPWESAFLKCHLYCTEALESTYHIRLWTCTFLFVDISFSSALHFVFFTTGLESLPYQKCPWSQSGRNLDLYNHRCYLTVL